MLLSTTTTYLYGLNSGVFLVDRICGSEDGYKSVKSIDGGKLNYESTSYEAIRKWVFKHQLDFHDNSSSEQDVCRLVVEIKRNVFVPIVWGARRRAAPVVRNFTQLTHLYCYSGFSFVVQKSYDGSILSTLMNFESYVPFSEDHSVIINCMFVNYYAAKNRKICILQ